MYVTPTLEMIDDLQRHRDTLTLPHNLLQDRDETTKIITT